MLVVSWRRVKVETLQSKAFGVLSTPVPAGNNAVGQSQPLNIVQVIARKKLCLYLLKSVPLLQLRHKNSFY